MMNIIYTWTLHPVPLPMKYGERGLRHGALFQKEFPLSTFQGERAGVRGLL
jgi:hypothetical protein